MAKAKSKFKTKKAYNSVGEVVKILVPKITPKNDPMFEAKNLLVKTGLIEKGIIKPYGKATK